MIGGVVATATRVFEESDANDGTIANPVSVQVSGATFAGAVGSDLTDQVTAAGVPGGLRLTARKTGASTLELTLTELSASDMQVAVSLLQGSTLLASLTVDDLGATFGGNAVGSGLLTGSQSIYTQFDQLFFRNSDNTEAATLDITNFNVTLTPAPEPTSLSLLAASALPLLRRRRHPQR